MIVTDDQLTESKRALVHDAAWASLAGALHGGVILTGFALALGAGPLIIGLLAAIPLIAQAAQLPAIVWVERSGERRKIAMWTITIARVVILGLAVIPCLSGQSLQLALLVAAQAVISVLGSVGGCSLNSWLHQLLPTAGLGVFFGQRLFWATTLACVGSLYAGYVIDHWRIDSTINAYSVVFAGAGIAGFISSGYLSRVREPPMPRYAAHLPIWPRIRLPFHDENFRKLLLFMGAWNVASNLALPFLPVYLMRQLGLTLGTVTTLWVVSQAANALTIYLWGRLSDRLSNKAVLAVALPIYFACLLGMVFTALPGMDGWTLPALYFVHIVMGAASGGIGLATGNIGLKLAPQGQGTPYLAAISLVGATAGGFAPIMGGALAEWFSTYKLSILVRWTSPLETSELTVLGFSHWEFLFAISAALGFYVMHTLSRIEEGEKISERAVMQELGLEAMRTVNNISSIAGLLAIVSAFSRLLDRRARPR
ncbi:MAG: hypothetical protein JWN94_794 [Betaproteobacteria bacterium]|nr:hypothetical protein [Betaproteobacteria bacterium]